MTTATATAPATFELDESLKARILDLAGRRKTGPLEIVREALAHLEREEDEDEAFYREALEAERDYQETGLHITGEEAIEWIKTWGTDHEREAPECPPESPAAPAPG